MSAGFVALISPYLSPGSIGPRAARSRRLAQGFTDAGYRVRAVVVDNGFSEVDFAGAEILASAAGPLVGEMGEPGMSAARQLRAAFAEAARRLLPLPDAHIRWALNLARHPALAERPRDVDVIYAVAAPFSSLVLGAALGGRWGVPVIGDLGDPWPTRGAAESSLARWTLNRLDALIVTNEKTADVYRGQIRAGTPLVVAPNGADVLRRGNVVSDGAPPLFLQLGTLSNLRVDPAPAFDALARLDREGLIRFRSHGEAWVKLAPQAARHHLGVIPEDEARTLMGAASALVVVGNRNAIQIPSKVYEIARSDIWALCVSELVDEPGAELLRRSGHGLVAGNSESEIRAAALEILGREEQGARPTPVPDFSWEETVRRASGVLAQVCDIDEPSLAPRATPARSARRGLRHARVRVIAARITSDRASRRRLVRMLEQERFEPPDPPEPVALRALGGEPVWLRPGSADSDVAVGAFHGLYHLPSADIGSPGLIWDLGCNIGLTMRQMAAVYPQAKIIGVDLDEENLGLARRNIESVADRCTLVKGAVWVEAGTVTYSTPDGEDAYRVAEGGTRHAEAILLDRLRQLYGNPDYVKMDIEGAESKVLSSQTGWADAVSRIGVEYHAPYDLQECERDLRELGFEHFEVHRRGLLRRGSDSLYASKD